jgi:hypothetical protein
VHKRLTSFPRYYAQLDAFVRAKKKSSACFVRQQKNLDNKPTMRTTTVPNYLPAKKLNRYNLCRKKTWEMLVGGFYFILFFFANLELFGNVLKKTPGMRILLLRSTCKAFGA